MLVFISDGKPSDKLLEHQQRRQGVVCRLAAELKSKLTFFGMGIGASGSDFYQLQLLANTAQLWGAKGQFIHAGLNPASLSVSLSSMATSLTTSRNDLLSKRDMECEQIEKQFTMKRKANDVAACRTETDCVTRWLFDPKKDEWRQVDFFNHKTQAFEIEKDPFGKGVERLAYMFRELQPKHIGRGMGWEQVGNTMVAKGSRFIEDEETRETRLTDSCRVQTKARELAKLFNGKVKKSPLLKPTKDEASFPPPIIFLKCSVYEYMGTNGDTCALLVEKYLKGKFKKFSSNNGHVNANLDRGQSINLEIGEAKLTDFVHAFSHWVYVYTDHDLLVCDLQGILDLEGRGPVFRLTDPAICSKGKRDRNGSRGRRRRYGKTDLGMRGIRNFCCRHICNNVCRGLNLPSIRNGTR
ncbi:hypothetical protein ACHAWF_004422 [Thalassiosira exigua]